MPWSWPDVVACVVDALRPVLATAAVATRVPEGPPGGWLPLVRVQRVGGAARQGGLDDARVLVECWAATDAAAWDLVAAARDVLRRLPGTGPVRACAETGGPALLADPLTGTPRYLLTAVVTVRATTAPPP